MIGKKGENLIFLISQPSSGSTLVQQVLMNHKSIHSIPEPWILLAPLTINKPEIVNASYSKSIEIGMIDRLFKNNFSDSEYDYFKFVNEACIGLYNKLLNNKKTHFLDKTPRYYLIVDEIVKAFPLSKILILKRNPVSVFVSVYNILGRERWNRHATENYIDFVTAVDKLTEFNNKNVLCFKYEDFLNSFNKEIGRILNFLNLDEQEGMSSYLIDASLAWGDNSGNIKKYNKVMPRDNDDWKKKIKNTELFLQTQEYLAFLGEKKIEKYGYNFNQIMKTFEGIDVGKLEQIEKPLSIQQSIFGKPPLPELTLIQKLINYIIK